VHCGVLGSLAVVLNTWRCLYLLLFRVLGLLVRFPERQYSFELGRKRVSASICTKMPGRRIEYKMRNNVNKPIAVFDIK
jgi:hypothetical protein